MSLNSRLASCIGSEGVTDLSVVEAASQGDLTKDITVSGEDDLGRVGQGLNTFFQTLRKSLGRISDNATALAVLRRNSRP